MNLLPTMSALWCLLTALGSGLCLAGRAEADERIIEMPVHVYCYSFVAAPHLDCKLNLADVSALMGEVNRIWDQANIRLSLMSVSARSISVKDFPSPNGLENRDEIRKQQIAISPTSETGSRNLNVVLVGQFSSPSGGVYRPITHTVFFAERNGRGEPQLPTVLAHEIGHALSLTHTDIPGNLMRIGNAREATGLTDEQIRIARAQALRGPADVTDMQGEEGIGIPNPVKEYRGMGLPADIAQRRANIIKRFRGFDSNGDGIILRRDVPAKAFQLFDLIDIDRDGTINDNDLNNFARGAIHGRRNP